MKIKPIKMDIALENLDPVFIEGYNISVLSYEEMQALAGDIIIKESKLDQSKMSQPGWLNDSRMGTLSLTEECDTCTGKNCPGHLGLIQFGKGNEIINPIYIRDVIKILNCVCHSCSRLLFDDELRDKKGKMMSDELRKILKKNDIGVRLTLLEKYCLKIKKCPMIYEGNIKKCSKSIKLKASNIKDNGIIQYDIVNKDKSSKDEGKVKSILSSTILTILKNIRPEDQKVLGFVGETKPVNLIMQGILVTPPLARAPITDKNGEPIQNPITVFYSDVIKAVNNKNNAPGEIYKAVRALLLKNDNNKKGGQETKSIGELMQGKKGIYRQATKGKRCDWTARTVASPGEHLKFGQAELPEEWRYILSKPRKVTHFNIKEFQKLLDNDHISHIINERGLREPVNKNNRPKLQIGQEVEILLREGDRITMNRQPSLHRASMQGLEIQFGKHQVIKNNLSITTPLNLDHDGDELNAWIPRDYTVEAEIEFIMASKNCIISTATGKAQMGLVMNSVTAAYLLTLPDVEISEDIYMNMIDVITNKEALPTLSERLQKFGFNLYRTDLNGQKLYSGKAAISTLFPPDFEYNHKGVLILEGILISGILTKSHVGPSSRSIVQELAKHYSLDRAADFLTDAPFLLTIYIQNRGFTVGINDCVNMVVDSKTEMYNKKYNKKAILFQEEYDKLKEIVYSKKVYQNIGEIGKKVNDIIQYTITNNNDLSFNKYISSQLKSFDAVISLTTQDYICQQDDKEIMALFQTFFNQKLQYRNKLTEYMKEFENINLPEQKITEHLYLRLQSIIHQLNIVNILSSQDLKFDALEKKINQYSIAKDADSIQLVIKNIFDKLQTKPSKLSNVDFNKTLKKLENLLKKYSQEGIHNIYYYNQFKEIQKQLPDKPYESVKEFLSQPFVLKWLNLKTSIITETNENIESFYEKLFQENQKYENIVNQFVEQVYSKLLQCNSDNKKNAILSIFNEKLFVLLSLMYKNLINTLNQEYNKNFIVKKEELAKVLLDLEAIGSKKGLSVQEQEYKENLIMDKVNVAKSIGVILAKNASKSNAIIAQTEEGAGTKGSSANVGQIKGAVGQQYVSGKRIWVNKPRLSSHYDVDDESPEARGLVESSFYEGLTPTEMFFIQAAGRENIIETYMKTPSIGKLSRFLQRSLENVIVAYDGSVRNSNGFLYSLSYNGGFDISKTLNVGTYDKPLLSTFIDLNKIIDEENHKLGWYTRSELAKTNIKLPNKKFSLEEEFTSLLNDEVVYEPIIIDSKYDNIDDKLTLYEKARIIGVRAQMLNNDDVPRVESDLTDAMDIAKLEYSQGLLANDPAIVIRRTYPNGTHKDIYPTLQNI